MATQNFRVKNGLEVGIGATILIAQDTGNVGVNTTAPEETLTVYKEGVAALFRGDNYTISALTSTPRLRFGTDTSYAGYMELGAYNSINNLDTKTRDFNLFSDAVDPILYVKNATGNVGIGTNAPTAKLDVRGTLNVSGITTITDDLELTRGSSTTSLTRKLVIGGARNNGSDFATLQFKNHDANSGAVDYVAAEIKGSVPTAANDGGELVFLTAADGATSQTERVRITSAGDVGIGTDIPASNARLHVVDDGNVGGIALGNAQNAESATLYANWNSLQIAADQYIYLRPANTTAVTLNPSGNVGIGTENPGAKLDVDGDIYVGDKIATRQNPTTSFLDLDDDTDPFGAGNGNFVTLASVSGLNLIFDTNNNDANGLVIGSGDANTANATKHMVVSGGGLVGIGTDDPSYKLQVEGDIKLGELGTLWFSDSANSVEKIEGTLGELNLFADAEVRFYESDSNTEKFSIDVNNAKAFFENDDDTYWHRPAGDTHAWTTAGVERLRIKNNGSIGIGTNDPSSALHLRNNTPIITFEEADASADNRRWNVGVNGEEFYWQAISDSGSGGGNLFKMTRVNQALNTFEGQKGGNTWFIVDNANRRIGVRTDIADAAFDVYGNSKFRDDVEFYGPSVGIASAVWDSSANLLNFKDNVKATFGDGNDLQIYHDGSHSWIRDEGGGHLYIRTNGDRINLNSDTGSLAKFNKEGSVELYYNNSKKFETTGYGVTVSGGAYVSSGSTITRSDSGVTLDVVGDFDTGVKNTLRVRSEYDRDAGIEIANSVSKWNIWIDGAADDALQFTDNAGNLNIELKHGGSTDLFYSNSKKFETRTDGIAVSGIVTAISGIVTYYGDGTNLDLTNSVALGGDTTGDYVQSITGTANEVEVTGGSGEGSTPQIGLPNNVTIGQDLTVTRDLQVNRDLNVNGTITVGGTSATLFTQTLQVADADLVLGIRTDGSGNDVSTDTTANHGGIAIASTEGTPLVTLVNPGAGETLPATYKKIMWFKSGSFSGLGTDAWLINYGVGIGSTQVPNNVVLAAGDVHVTNNDIIKVGDINASGIITASTFVSNVSTGTSPLTVTSTTLVSNLNADKLDGQEGTYYLNYANFSGIATDSDKLDGQQGTYYLSYSNFVGLATDSDKLDGQQGSYYLDYANFSGIATDSDKLDGQEGSYYLNYSNFSGIATDSDKLDGQQGTYYLDYTNFSGIATDSDKLDGQQGTYYLDYSNFVGVATDSDKLDGQEGTYYLDYANFVGIATDSDKLDGQQGTYYLDYANFSGIATDSDKLDGQQGSYYLNYSNFSGIATDSDKLDGQQGSYYLSYSNFVGVATDSDKLDGQDGTYYLNYSNFTNTPPDVRWFGTAVGIWTSSSVGIGTTNPTSTLTVDGTLNVSGVSTFQDNVHLGDDDVLKFGDNEDLEIYSNGTNSFIKESGGGNLKILGTNIILRNSGDTKTYADFNNGGSLELYYDNSKKFETTGVGVSIVNGTSDTATIYGPSNLIIDPMPIGVGTTSGVVRIKGDLFVDGTTTQINSTTLEIADFVVGIASTATTDLLADGAGIGIGSDKTFLYEHNSGTNPSLQSSENLSVATGKVYQIGTTERLSADTLSLGTGTTIHSPGSNRLTFGTAGQERVRITSDGEFGIGTNDPLALLHVEKTTQGEIARFRGSSAARYLTISSFNAGFDGSGFDFNATSNAGEISFSTQNVEKVRIDNAGNLGIGTNAPTAKLDVRGTLNVTGVSTFTGDVNIGTGATTAFFDVSSGSVGIGTINPTAKLDVRGSLNVTGVSTFSDDLTLSKSGTPNFVVQTSNNSGQDALIKIRGARTASSTSNIAMLQFDNKTDFPYTMAQISAMDPAGAHGNGKGKLVFRTATGGTLSDQVTIMDDGDVGIGTTTPTEKLDVVGTVKAIDFDTTSDQNLKTNIKIIEDPLEKIVQIRGVNFEWKENNKPSAGVIAQEVEKVLPELVTNNGTRAVNYNGLIGLLIEAVKAQQEEINMLKERLK